MSGWYVSRDEADDVVGYCTGSVVVCLGYDEYATVGGCADDPRSSGVAGKLRRAYDRSALKMAPTLLVYVGYVVPTW